MADLPNPHDALIRTLLEDAERARDFLRDHLPNSIAAQLADDPPQIIDGSFVDEALAGSQSDLLMKVRLKTGGDAFVYVLAEHTSKPSPALPIQLAGYMVRIWKRLAGNSHRKLRALPPIIPMVINTNEKAWTVPAGLAEMIASDDPDLVFLPGERYILRNLCAMPIDALSRNDALRAGFIALRKEAMDHMAMIARALPPDSVLWRQILEYVVRTYDDVGIDDLKAALRREGQTELEALVGTIADTMLLKGSELGFAKGMAVGEAKGLAAGKAEGRAQGEAAGEARGEARGKSDTLRRLLERRFGSLPSDVVARMDAASLAQLDAWLDAAFDADSLEAVFGSDRGRRPGRS